jgi:hypothetical protein
MLALSSIGDLERTAPTTSRFTCLYKMVQATGLELLEPRGLLSGLYVLEALAQNILS